MENRNVSDLLQQYAQQTENVNSLANGEVEAQDTCSSCCDCCEIGRASCRERVFV